MVYYLLIPMTAIRFLKDITHAFLITIIFGREY